MPTTTLIAAVMATAYDDENYTKIAALQHLDEQPELLMLAVPWTLTALRPARDPTDPSPK